MSKPTAHDYSDDSDDPINSIQGRPTASTASMAGPSVAAPATMTTPARPSVSRDYSSEDDDNGSIRSGPVAGGSQEHQQQNNNQQQQQQASSSSIQPSTAPLDPPPLAVNRLLPESSLAQSTSGKAAPAVPRTPTTTHSISATPVAAAGTTGDGPAGNQSSSRGPNKNVNYKIKFLKAREAYRKKQAVSTSLL